MQAVRVLGGNPFHILDLKLSATVVVGQPVNASSADGQGGWIDDPGTTDLTDMVGLVLGSSSHNPHGGGSGTLTYSVTQGDTEGLVRVVVNPHLIISARMSGSTTEGTDLTTYTAASAVSGGTGWTDSDASTDMDEATTWAIAPNANVGESRRITAHTTGTGAVVVTVPFTRATAAGDAFLIAPFTPCKSTVATPTAAFTEIDASIAEGSGGAPIDAIELILNGPADSFLYWLAGDHFFNKLS